MSIEKVYKVSIIAMFLQLEIAMISRSRRVTLVELFKHTLLDITFNSFLMGERPTLNTRGTPDSGVLLT